jgi:hypothetical protein
MKQSGFEALSSDMESLLAQERVFPEERGELRARALTRARRTLEALSASSTRSFWQRRVTLLVAAALVLGFAAAAIAARLPLRRPTGQAPSVPPALAVTPARAQALEPARPKADVPAGTPSEVVSEVPERPSVGPKARRSSAADANDTDALELGLLQRTRGAVAKGEFSTALDAIAEHQRRFPAGRLREEREALRIKALAGLGRNDEAQRAAERFRERFPRSVLSRRIEETVRPNP